MLNPLLICSFWTDSLFFIIKANTKGNHIILNDMSTYYNSNYYQSYMSKQL